MSPAKASTLSFNDGSFPNPVDGQMVYEYHGFSWYNLRENLNQDLRNVVSHIGSTSTENSSITSLGGDGFYFNQLDIQGESSNPITVNLLGYFHGNQLFSFTRPISNNYLSVINTDYEDIIIDRLVIDWADSGSSIHLDNFTYYPVPEPSTLIMGIVGIAGIALKRFKAPSVA